MNTPKPPVPPGAQRLVLRELDLQSELAELRLRLLTGAGSWAAAAPKRVIEMTAEIIGGGACKCSLVVVKIPQIRAQIRPMRVGQGKGQTASIAHVEAPPTWFMGVGPSGGRLNTYASFFLLASVLQDASSTHFLIRKRAAGATACRCKACSESLSQDIALAQQLATASASARHSSCTAAVALAKQQRQTLSTRRGACLDTHRLSALL